MGWGPPNVEVDQVEAGGAEGERIYLRQNEGDGRLLNTPQGSPGRTAEEGGLHRASGTTAVFKGERRRYHVV